MKTHLNFATADLSKAVAFYRTLLDAKPAKVREDYALFITEEPPLELALDRNDSASPSPDAHYGIYVDTEHEVERAIERLERAGLAKSVERDQTCCYANQTKVWAIDPDGRRWEVYTVHEDTQERNFEDTTCCSSDGEARSCCAA